MIHPRSKILFGIAGAIFILAFAFAVVFALGLTSLPLTQDQGWGWFFLALCLCALLTYAVVLSEKASFDPLDLLKIHRFLLSIILGTLLLACMFFKPFGSGSVPEFLNKVLSGHATDASAKDPLAWGEAQLKRMLKDRPEMAKYVNPGDDLWAWTVSQFAGAGGDGPVEWDPKDPDPLWDALFYGSWKGRKAHIQVTNFFYYKDYHRGEPKTGPVLWYETMFELINIARQAPVKALTSQVIRGELDRKAYIQHRILQEWGTMQMAHDLFHSLWIPHCEKLGLEPEDQALVDLYGKGILVLDREGVLAHFAKPGTYHYEYYGKMYDIILKDPQAQL